MVRKTFVCYINTKFELFFPLSIDFEKQSRKKFESDPFVKSDPILLENWTRIRPSPEQPDPIAIQSCRRFRVTNDITHCSVFILFCLLALTLNIFILWYVVQTFAFLSKRIFLILACVCDTHGLIYFYLAVKWHLVLLDTCWK